MCLDVCIKRYDHQVMLTGSLSKCLFVCIEVTSGHSVCMSVKIFVLCGDGE